MPMYRKAWDIVNIVDRIKDLIPEEKEMLLDIAQNMQADASLLTAKIAGAFGADLYDLKMEMLP